MKAASTAMPPTTPPAIAPVLVCLEAAGPDEVPEADTDAEAVATRNRCQYNASTRCFSMIASRRGRIALCLERTRNSIGDGDWHSRWCHLPDGANHVVFKLRYTSARAALSDGKAASKSDFGQPVVVEHGLLLQHPQNGGSVAEHFQNCPALHSWSGNYIPGK